MATLRCRPSESEKEPAMIFMSSPQMLNLKLRNGDLCRISHDGTSASAVVWLTSKSDIKESVVGISKWMQDRCGIKLGNDVHIVKVADDVPGAQVISVRPLEDLSAEKRLIFELTAAVTLSENYRYLIPAQRFWVVVGKVKKEFEITGPSTAIYKSASVTKVRIGSEDDFSDNKITFASIGGLEVQKHRIQQQIRMITSGSRRRRKHTLTAHATGVLLYGPAGTGKSTLRRAIEAEYDWSNVTHWEGAGAKTPTLTASQLVHVPMPTKLSPVDAKALEQLFRALPETTLIVGEIRDPNDLQSFLRTSSTFSHEIEVSIPDAEQRLEILKLLNNDLLSNQLLRDTAQKTHGYVGDDLSKLLIELETILDDEQVSLLSNGVVKQNGSNSHAEAESDQSNQATDELSVSGPGHAAGHAVDQTHDLQIGDMYSSSVQPEQPQVTSDHLTKALTRVRPSALQQVFLEKPDVKWSDIGGQEPFKARLRNAVEWPLKYPKELKAYGIPQKKGILLYGPPGCSKTMLVKALATESDYNFLAVKGAELISMYVGESERATREVFRKARAASPCIIFFDEIDAIARRASGNSELNVLTTLLNEMDGFEELKDVLVVAATNKPQAIDPALMRPGRFDNVVYIGPPDKVTREAILREQFRKTIKFSTEARDKIHDFVLETEGMSGAEVVAACQAAGEIAFSSGETLREILTDDVLEAVRKIPRAITKQMLHEYETWNAERAAS